MSLLKLLFDLPEAGGESNFTVEEQEELMAFEHNLDERLVENFNVPAIPASDEVQFDVLEGAGAEAEDGGSNDPVEGPVDLPDGNGAYGGHDFEMANGVQVKDGLVSLMNVVQNGHIFGSSTAEHFTQAVPHIVGPITEEPGSVEKNVTAYKALESSMASVPETTPATMTLDSASVTLPAIMPATATLEPAAGTVQEIAPARKYDISSKHQGSGKAVWIKVRILFKHEELTVLISHY